MTSLPTQNFSPGYMNQYSGNRLVVVASVFIAAEIIFVALSFVAKIVGQRQRIWRREEWFTVFGLGCNLAMNAISLAGIKYLHAGHHLSYILTLHPTALPTFLKMEITFTILYILSITLPKLTMLSLFLRIFVNRQQRRASYIIAIILLATALANIIANVTQCVPLDYLWDKHGDGTCFNQNSYWRWASLPNILTDILMLGLPVPVILGTQMGWRDKAGVGVTFFAGSLGLITSILRFAAFWRMQPASDITWTSIELCAYSIAEGGVYLIASCLPAYRALYLTMKRPRPWPCTDTLTRNSSNTRLASRTWGVFTPNPNPNSHSQKRALHPSSSSSISRSTSQDTSPETGISHIHTEIQIPRSSRGKPTRIHISAPSPIRAMFPEHGDIGQLFRPPWPRRHSSLGHCHDADGIIIQQDFSIEYEDVVPLPIDARGDRKGARAIGEEAATAGS